MLEGPLPGVRITLPALVVCFCCLETAVAAGFVRRWFGVDWMGVLGPVVGLVGALVGLTASHPTTTPGPVWVQTVLFLLVACVGTSVLGGAIADAVGYFTHDPLDDLDVDIDLYADGRARPQND